MSSASPRKYSAVVKQRQGGDERWSEELFRKWRKYVRAAVGVWMCGRECVCGCEHLCGVVVNICACGTIRDCACVVMAAADCGCNIEEEHEEGFEL